MLQPHVTDRELTAIALAAGLAVAAVTIAVVAVVRAVCRGLRRNRHRIKLPDP